MERIRQYSLSFIIPVLNGSRHIAACLEHICKQMRPSDEIIVVDNGSTDDTVKIAKQFNVKLLYYPDITIAALRNRGAEIAKSDLLVFIDSDCLLVGNWRQTLEEIMSDESIQATGSGSEIPDTATWVERAWLSERPKFRVKASYINSGHFIVRKDVFLKLQGFDERLITDEDSDIGNRMSASGYVILLAPDLRMIHLGNAKTLMEHYRRQKWHSASILESLSKKHLDKALLMSFLFMICGLLSLLLLAAAFSRIVYIPLAIAAFLIVPIITVLYRIYTYKNYRYFLQLIALYLAFYIARSIVILQIIGRRIFRKKVTMAGRVKEVN